MQVTYDAGYDDTSFRQTDLHQALTELLALKLDRAQAGGQTLKRVSAGGARRR